jgi:metallo-beta-lactamase class B
MKFALMKKHFILVFVVTLTTAITATCQKPDGWQKYLDESNRPVKPFRIIGNVYYVGMNDLASYLIATKDGLILVDTALEESGPIIRKNIETLGFKPSDVKIILSGHAHFDHVAGHQTMKELTGAKIYATAPDAMILESGGTKGFFSIPTIQIQAGDGRQGHRRWRVGEAWSAFIAGSYASRPHRGKYRVVIRSRERTVKKYNVLIAPSMSVNPGVKLVNNKEWPGVADAYIDSFKKLRALKCDVFLAPHAGFFDLEGKMARMNGKTNPFVDPEGFVIYVDEMEKKFGEERKKAVDVHAQWRMTLDCCFRGFCG